MPMKTIYVVRHGETKANAAGIVSGGEHDTPLTENGKAQAAKAGKDLKSKRIELVVSSPQGRAIATATIIAKELGYDSSRIVINELFAEAFMGPYSGQSREVYHADREANNLKDGIEPRESHYNRIAKALDSLRDLKQSRILVVSHGATTMMTKLVVQGLHHSQLHMIERVGNAEVFEFTLD